MTAETYSRAGKWAENRNPNFQMSKSNPITTNIKPRATKELLIQGNPIAIKFNIKRGVKHQIKKIKCLDEGVNIPGIQTAFILASTTNPKEYIQRRGRVLRKSPQTGKEFAEIFDFVTLPRPLDEVPGLTEDQMKRDLSLVKNELARVMEFGRLAMNSMEATQLIWNICDCYNLPYDFIDSDKEEPYGSTEN